MGGLGLSDIRTQEEKLNDWYIDKGQWIVLREALLHIKPTGFR